MMNQDIKQVREEELKNVVARELFPHFDCTQIISYIDFAVTPVSPKGSRPIMDEYLLWAEAKRGTGHNIYHSLTQLLLTIGRNSKQTIDRHLPPKYLGAFDAEKIAFVPYSSIVDIFFLNDFDWTVTPSDYTTKEFGILHNLVHEVLDRNMLLFDYQKDDKELRAFIQKNFKVNGQDHQRVQVNRTNFIHIYQRWRESVMPSIGLKWDMAKKAGIISADFFLADLISKDSATLIQNLFVVLSNDHYIADRKINDLGMFTSSTIEFTDKQKAYHQFWNLYERPPKREYWDYIIKRRDLLVPQDVRERKGSFFTPPQWVELSQEYLAKALGEEWQEEYYIWDCCAGTGNLLAGLTNKYNIYASTLDRQDVDIMQERIRKMNDAATRTCGEVTTEGGSNLLESHVFRFDFLNDPFTKLPESLQAIINDPEKRKKLVIYINPPYAETANDRTQQADRLNKRGVSFTKTRDKYAELIGIATKELYAQFIIRVYKEINGCILAEFSTLKILQGSNFSKFRSVFRAKFNSGFIVPANTFDNVNGSFPIGFKIWDTQSNRDEDHFIFDIYDAKQKCIGLKNIVSEDLTLTEFYKKYHNRELSTNTIGSIGLYGSDFQHSKYIAILSTPPNRWTYIFDNNLIPTCIYLSVRHCIEATWINDRDQFLYPRDTWQADREFQTDCLAFTLFHGQNRITCAEGTNHWIPFTEEEVGASDRFESHFMTDFISGRLPLYTAEVPTAQQGSLFSDDDISTQSYPTGQTPLSFSPEACLLFDAGRRL